MQLKEIFVMVAFSRRRLILGTVAVSTLAISWYGLEYWRTCGAPCWQATARLSGDVDVVGLGLVWTYIASIIILAGVGLSLLITREDKKTPYIPHYMRWALLFAGMAYLVLKEMGKDLLR